MVSTASASPCPSYTSDEQRISRTGQGHLSRDVSILTDGVLLIADFGSDWRHLKDATADEPLFREWISRFEQDDSFKLIVLGYSDCVGTEANNVWLRRGRAEAVLRKLGPRARSRVSLSGPAPLKDYVDTNATVMGRARNRSVTIAFQQDIQLSPDLITANRCSVPIPARDFADYIVLLRCLESAYRWTKPRIILSVVRQLYYGTEPWSRSTLEFWQDVIPCGTKVGNPRSTLGAALFSALADKNQSASQIIQGVDVGHVFTGLEAMCCPSAQVTFEVRFWSWDVKSIEVDMSNEAFATWGGDLASAVGARIGDEIRLGRVLSWSGYIGPGTLVSEEDLNGDIDSYVIRAVILGRSCAGSTLAAIGDFPTLVSDIVEGYYVTGAGPFHGARRARIGCFLESMGGNVVQGALQNPADVVAAMAEQVSSASEVFLLQRLQKRVGMTRAVKEYFGSGSRSKRMAYSVEICERFVTWLDCQLRSGTSCTL
jgi:hypothetical protein